MEKLQLEKGKKVYFASDFHLGIPDLEKSRDREMKLVNWLESIRNDAAEIYLMGDLFDFWFEYKTVIPKGFVRLFGKLAEITDTGLPVYLFRGNHDIWAFDYLENEIGLKLERESKLKLINGKKFYLAHGDGLGPGDNGYKFLKKVFELKFNQWLFRWLHPDLGARMALYFSRKSRIANIIKEGKKENGIPLEKEMLFQFALSESAVDPEINFFVFGHRHVPIKAKVRENSELIILGDWVTNFTYGVFDGEAFHLEKLEH